MKRKTLALLLSLVLAFGLTACGGETSADGTGSEQETEQTPQTVDTGDTTEGEISANTLEGDCDDFHVVVNGCSFSTDWDGNKVIVINYTATNNSESETKAPMFDVYFKAFQDGIQLEVAMMDGRTYNEQKEVRPGVTLEDCEEAFVLTSDSPVEIEANGLLDSKPVISTTYEVE